VALSEAYGQALDWGRLHLLYSVVKVDQNAPELSSQAQKNCQLAVLDPKFSKFLLERWSLAAGTLIRGLESRLISPSVTTYYDHRCVL